MRPVATFFATLVVTTIALPVYAQGTMDIPCVQAAVLRRENTNISALDSYNTTVRSALIARRDALHSAWTIADKSDRKDAIRNAERAYKTTEKTAKKSRQDTERTARRTYDYEVEFCER